MGRPNRTSPGCKRRASPLAPLAPPRRERSPAQATAPRFAREPELATARSATAAPARGSGRALRPSDVLTRCLRKSHLESVGPTRRGGRGTPREEGPAHWGFSSPPRSGQARRARPPTSNAGPSWRPPWQTTTAGCSRLAVSRESITTLSLSREGFVVHNISGKVRGIISIT